MCCVVLYHHKNLNNVASKKKQVGQIFTFLCIFRFYSIVSRRNVKLSSGKIKENICSKILFFDDKSSSKVRQNLLLQIFFNH